MARLAVTFTVIFLLFAFSHARIPLDLPEDDVNSHDPSLTLTGEDTKTTILLPSEKPDTEPDTVVDLEPEAEAMEDARPIDSELSNSVDESNQELPEIETESVDSSSDLTRPLTVVTFRPTKLHTPYLQSSDRRSAFRFPHRCGHHHRGHFRRGPPFNRHVLPYGNDMSEDPIFREGGVRKIPARWMKFHHHGRPRFSFRHGRWNSEDMKKEKRPFHHMMEEEEEKKHHEAGGMMKRFRKFLNHF